MRRLGLIIWRFMVIFSFIVNFVLILVLALAGLFIFQIKNQVADPLITGLHATSVGLEEATIDWVIPVRDRIPVVLNIPLQTDTNVVLTDPVPLNVNAVIDLPGLNASNVPAFVSLTLPRGLELPVALDLDVPVDEELDVALDVRAVIPIGATQLDDPINTLGLLFEPLAIGLHNLPNNFSEAGTFVGQVVGGADLGELLLSTDGSGFNVQVYDPWFGYTQTAGLNYDLFTEAYPEAAQTVTTGVNIPGGIPALDAILRPEAYGPDGNFVPFNPFAAQSSGAPLPPETFDGSMQTYYSNVQSQFDSTPLQQDPVAIPDTESEEATTEDGTTTDDSGIIPTPTQQP